jgi:BirA family transcriptional regulator, biotin operon repressor / biotin---[acetyl-CoA-carboxylase] ligase
MVCLAERQEKGRGRAGRDWSSQEALNITASFLIRPKSAQNVPCINFAAAIAVAEAAKEFGAISTSTCLPSCTPMLTVRGIVLLGVDAKLKWPNDVWCNGKKLCGVLTDAEFVGSDIFVTLGIGINVNQSISSESLLSETATSFSDILGRKIPREELFASVCNALESLIDLDMKDILDKYRQYDMLIGRQIVVMPKRREGPLSDRFEARALGLDPEQGCLVVQTTDGTRKLLSAEEVSIRPGS